jgi:Putative general bacterial porin
MFKKAAMVAGLGLALSATAQAEYNAEANLAISGGDNDGFAIGGTYYLDSVDDTKGPLGEAAFLDMSSYVSAAYSENEFDDSDNETELVAVGGRYIFGEGNWIVDVGYSNFDADAAGELDTFSISGGKYLTDTTTLILSYANTDPDDGEDADIYGIDVDHLLNVGEGALKLHGGFSTADTDGDDIDFYGVDATWYPCNSLGLGVGYGNTDDGSDDIDEYRISAEWFITNQVSASVTYLEAEQGDLESDSFLIGVSARF